MKTSRASFHVIQGAQQRRWRMPTFRCKLRRADGMTLDYVGPFGDWQPEWHIILRRAAR